MSKAQRIEARQAAKRIGGKVYTCHNGEWCSPLRDTPFFPHRRHYVVTGPGGETRYVVGGDGKYKLTR